MADASDPSGPNQPTAPSPFLAPSPKEMPARWNFAAAFLGWLLPGLGHFARGQPQRAVVLGTTIGTLWLTGLLIGGISVIDRSNQPAWFLGQMLVAPSFVANGYRERLVAEHAATRRTFDPQDEPPFEPAFARAQEQGTLFTSLAGLLNLLAIIDVLYRDPRERHHTIVVPTEPTPDGATQ